MPRSEPPPRPLQTPPPKSEPKSPKKEEPQLDERLTQWVKLLKNKKPQERLRAVVELGNLKEVARPVAAQVCMVLAGDPIPAVRQGALEALEKIHPELHIPIVVFVVEADAQKHIKATRDVMNLGEQGRAAVPVLLSHIQTAPARFVTKAPALIVADAQALAQIAPDDPVTQKALLELTCFSFTPPRYRADIGGPVRTAAVRVLGELLDKHPDQASAIGPRLIAMTRNMTDERVRGQAIVLLGKVAENHANLRPQIAACFVTLANAGDMSVVAQFGKCGGDAKDALPLLKKLKLHPTESIRTAANKAIQQIEEAVANAGSSTRTEDGDTTAKPKPRTEEEGLSPELQAVVSRLKRGTTEERLKAAAELAEMGEKAQPATRALCEVAMSPSQKVAHATLEALEKVNPEIHKPVFILIVDEKADKHLEALHKLSLLGEQGKPATTVVLHEIKRCRELFNDPQARWGLARLIQVTEESMKTLPKIAADDPQALKTIIDLTKFTMVPVVVPTRRRFIQTTAPFRANGLTLLGELAEGQPDFRKQIIPPVVALLKEAVQQTNASNENEILNAIAWVDHTSKTLLKCGDEAKQTLTKEVLPRLKDLGFHKSDNVRKTAEALRKKIEDAP